MLILVAVITVVVCLFHSEKGYILHPFIPAGFDINKVKVDINAAGENGDGTSGACPYETKCGREFLKAKYSTPTGQKELEDSKYVKIQVTFEDNSKKVSDSIPTYQPMYRCKKIEFKCE